MSARRRAGVLGVGQMGAGIARSLLRAGWEVLIAPRHPERSRDLVAAGARLLDGPADVAAGAPVIVTSLPDTASVEEVLLGPTGVLSGGSWDGVVIETSTIAPADARRLASELARRGVAMIDAPVSGGPAKAEDGTLAIMVGGPEATLERARPVLEAIGSRAVHCGAAGAGQVAKACNQLIVMGTLVAISEAFTVAEHAGVEPERVREAMLDGLAGGPILDVHGARMVSGDMAPGGRARFHQKDIAEVAAIATEAGLELPLFDAVRSRFERLFAMPGGLDLDHAAVYLTYPHDAPVAATSGADDGEDG